ncbi:dirigent protein 16-like [Vigna unguiculata]|uniref:Dirigent protein n=1 Tax=Vigna unguiculata TaxID=3917 RepID=A0A4D6MVW5_VIGUN|nr:dirigent protein 16-like [Vigna unguiculata]QCE05573.1 Plant disease resistance response protein [Vigna unguiculata]
MASTYETLGKKMAMGSLTAAYLGILLACADLAITVAAVDPIAATGKEHVIELYMHDILGGSNPTARPVTGLLGSIYSGQIPFATPVGFNTPQGAIPIPNANGANPTVNGVFGIPLGTGLAGTSFAPNSGNNNNNNQNLAQLQLGPDGLGLGFGTITVIDDMLTSQPEEGSQLVGKAQGVYVASSADGTRQMMAFTALFEGGEYGDSLNFYGLYKIGSTMSRISVLGGTGKFKNARGFAELRALIPPGQISTDGAETLLRITIYLKY